MKKYAGLDVSLKEVSICVVDEDGKVSARGVAATKADIGRDGSEFRVGDETASQLGHCPNFRKRRALKKQLLGNDMPWSFSKDMKQSNPISRCKEQVDLRKIPSNKWGLVQNG